MTRGKRSGGNKKVANGLVALSSAAVLGVYTAGFVRTRAAAQRFAEADQRRTPVRAQPTALAAPAVTALVTTEIPRQTAAAPAAAIRTDVPPPGPAPAAPGAKPRKATPMAAEASPPGAPRAPEPKPQPSKTPSPVAAAPAPDAAAAPAPAATGVAAAAPVAPVATVGTPTPVPAPAPATPPPTATVVYKDGSYTGWGTSRHGDIQATVVIENGRIASASISQCDTRYPCSWIVALPPQVAQRQSPEVDFVSGATQSTNAFYYAVVEALSKAK